MQRITDSIEMVLDFLREAELSKSTVKDYQVRYRMIQAYCESKKVVCFLHSEAQTFTTLQKIRCEDGEISERHFRRLRRSAFLLADCMNGDELTLKSIVFPKLSLSEFFSETLLQYKKYLSALLAPGTIAGVMSITRQFLAFLENEEQFDFKQMTKVHVRSFIRGVAEKHQGSMSDLIWAAKKFLLFLNENNLSTINAERYLLRSAPSKRKVLPCFSKEETNVILFAIDPTTTLGKRDYAIVKLAIETGLRVVDILNLKLSDINWRTCEIAIIQNKTDEAIQLPLMADVGNAIVDYILQARPQSDSPYIFLRTVKPHTKLGNTGNGKNIISRYLAKAGIEHKAWDGKTFHAFRRTHGTRLVEAEVPLPDIADLLGHKVLDSAKRYISHNDEMLRVCCLGILEYATRKEGLV